MVSWSVSQWKAHRGAVWSLWSLVEWSNWSFSCGQWRSQSSTASPHAVIQSWPPAELANHWAIDAKVPPTMHGSGRALFSHTCQSNNHTWSQRRVQVMFIVRSLAVCVSCRPGPLALGLFDSRWNIWENTLCREDETDLYSVKNTWVASVDMQKI